MSEDNNRPPSINLEELERQLREALSRRSATTEQGAAASGQEDPLSMLARLVEHEGGGRQQPIPPEPPSEPLRDALASAQPSHSQSVPQWQSFEDRTAPDFSSAAPVPVPVYPTNDHLVFDPNHTTESAPAASHSHHHTGFQPSSMSDPYSASSQPPTYGGYDQAPRYSQPETTAASHPEIADHYPSASPYGGSVTSSTDGTGHGIPVPDFLTQGHSAPSQSFNPSPSTPAHPPAGHDVWPLSAQTNTSVPDFSSATHYQGSAPQPPAQAHEQLYPNLTQSTPSAAYQPADQPADKAAADLSLVYGSVFPERDKRDNQWPDAQAKGVGLSYSEAEANLSSEQRNQEEPVKKRGGGMMILLALLVVVTGGLGVTYYLRNEGVRVPTGGPPVIVADKNPVKVVPTNPGGTEVPNQGSAIYQSSKTEDPKNAKVVSTDEKPVDISLAPRPPGSTLIGEPKKIRTVTVRPDGSVIDESTVAAGTTVPNSAALPRATPSMVTVIPPVSPQAATPPATTPAPTPQATQPVVPAAAPAAAAPVTAPAQPLPTSTNPNAVKTLPPSRPQQAEAPPPAAPQRVATTKEVEPPASGDYGVQFSAPGSEAEARNAIEGLKRTHSKIVEGLNLTAQKAENNGRTIFRVRAVGLSREEAISLCEKYKATGGQCFVARN